MHACTHLIQTTKSFDQTNWNASVLVLVVSVILEACLYMVADPKTKEECMQYLEPDA